MENETTSNKYGLSKKTNVAIAAMTALSAAQSQTNAIIAIACVGSLAIVIQGVIDFIKVRKEILND